MKFTYPVLQVALDFVELKRALKLAQEAVEGGADWLEAGTPLIKSEGMDSIRQLRRDFKDKYIVADLKTMDAGRVEVESAAKAGANCASILGAASDATLQECIEAGSNYGIDIAIDLINTPDPLARAILAQELGAHHVSLHIPIDEQMRGIDPLINLKKLADLIDIPIAVAGGLHSEIIADVVKAGAGIVIVGGAITKSVNAINATRDIVKAIKSQTIVVSKYFKRAKKTEQVKELFLKCSTPNISDAMHRQGELNGFIQVTPGVRFAGPCYTVRTYPGDWAKPVESIDYAGEGSVIVIDAGGVPPAVWGELATESCIQKKIAGVVINGACRDVDSIRALRFPVYSKSITPTAGEPKGFGEMNVTLSIDGLKISPGDWIVSDDSGLVHVTKSKIIEVANRAMDVLEKENRIREEIRKQGTLASVAEISKWEKQVIGKKD
ncbi:MAG: orotidine 5'-phosphate decarboxylase [Planctomycetes bacterium]|nr:orotidine 5'-phosphate decarboxylase [Planctomycetota bacterium]